MKKRKLIAFILSLVMVLACFSGCTNTDDNNIENAKNKMVETQLAAIPNVSSVLDVDTNANADLMAYCIDEESGQPVLYMSTDKGTSWNAVATDSVDKINENIPKNAFVTKGDITSGGTAIVCYKDTDETDEAQGNVILYIDSNTDKPKSFLPKGEQSVYDVRYSNNEKSIFVNRGDCLERYDLSGTLQQSYEQKNIIDYVESGTNVVLLSTDGLISYSMNKGELQQTDTTPAEEFQEELNSLYDTTIGVIVGTNHVLRDGTKKTVYLLLSSGMYKHTIGNDLMIRIIDGTGTHLAMSSSQTAGYWVGDEEHARVVCADNGVYTTYAYTLKNDAPESVTTSAQQTAQDNSNPDKPQGVMYSDGSYDLFGNYKTTYVAEINEELQGDVTVYSLRPNTALNNAVAVYQNTHPNITVKLEIGIEKDSNITVEQAINSLNTKLLAGTGPDVLFLDGLNRKKYEENGLLLDLSDVYKEITDKFELFANVTEVYQENNKMYAIPSRFSPSVLAGKKDVVDSISTLEDLADYVQMDTTTWGNALDMYSVKQFYNAVYPSYSNLIVKENGEYSETQLEDMVSQMKRMWGSVQTQTEKNDASEIWETIVNEGEHEDWEKWTFFNLRGLINSDITGRTLGMGAIYQEQCYLNPTWGCRYSEGYTYRSIPFGVSNSFEPMGIAAISVKSINQQGAKDFVEELFAPNEQTVIGSDSTVLGLPVNREGLRDLVGNTHGVTGGGLPYDSNFVMNFFYESQEEYDTFLDYLDSFEYAANMDEQVQEILLNQLELYLNGEIEIEEYLSGVKEKMEVYLSE